MINLIAIHMLQVQALTWAAGPTYQKKVFHFDFKASNI